MSTPTVKSTKKKVSKLVTKNIKLYFDANYICLGGSADDWWMPNYSGDYAHSNSALLTTGFNPVGRTELNFLLTCRHYNLMKRMPNGQ